MREQANNQTPAARFAGGVPLAADAQRPAGEQAADRSEFLLRLSGLLLELATENLPEPMVRERVRKLAVEAVGGLGACQLSWAAEGECWLLDEENRTGSLPSSGWLIEQLSPAAEQAVRRNTAQVSPLKLPGAARADVSAVMVPVAEVGFNPELLVVLADQCGDPYGGLIDLHRLAAILRGHLKRSSGRPVPADVGALAAIIDLVSRVERSRTQTAAMEVICSDIARHVQCSYVAVATCRGERLGAIRISGGAAIDARSHIHHDFRQALQETLLRNCPGRWPATEETNQLLLAHRQLAASLQCEALVSQPLVTVDGQVVGAWLVAGPKRLIHRPDVERLMHAASPRLASGLEVVGRAEQPLWLRAMRRLPELMLQRRVAMLLLAIAIVAGVLAIPVPYRIRCYCSLNPIERRFAVAPFDGLIARGWVRPGDTVEADQLLAEMDGQSIALELAGVEAEHLKAQRRRSIELAEHNIPELQMATLEVERLAAEQTLLEFRKANLAIRSPISGVVLSGSLERAEAAAVQRGQVLFEIGSAHKWIELEVPTEEIAHVRVGQPVTVWIEGMENRPLQQEIVRIHPRSELRHGRHVFVVELTSELPEDLPLRPGMRGSARIDADRHPLGWNLFHRPYELLVSYWLW
jgi:hypothetical protein